MLRVLISALLVVVAISALRVRPAGHGADSPKFVAPDVPDLTIKTRRTIDHPNSTIETELLNLKGAWQRRTQILDFPPTIPSVRTRRHVAITRCDERRAIDLNEEARTYASAPLADMAEHARPFRLTTPRRPPAVLTPADVQIVIDSVDTGERRRIGRYTARRVITTTTTEPSSGAKTHASKAVEAGWYIDVPPANCWDLRDRPSSAFLSVAPDPVRVEYRGTAKHGFPIEEISHSSSDGQTSTTRVELVEFSDSDLDGSLFTVPRGYQAALPRLTGGFDMTRPDTPMNRLHGYWEGLTSWAQYVFRF